MSTVVPNTFALQSGNVPALQLDANFSYLGGVIDALQAQVTALQAQVNALPTVFTGAIVAAGTLHGSETGSDYSTTSTTFVDVDSVNLKTTVTVPTGAKFFLCWLSVSTGLSTIADNASHVSVAFAGVQAVVGVFLGGVLPGPTATFPLFGVVVNPVSGPQTLTVQFRGDGTHAFVLKNPTGEGMASSAGPNFIAQPVSRIRLSWLLTN